MKNIDTLSRTEAAAEVGVSLRSFDRLVQRKEIRGFTVGRRRLFSHDEITAFLERAKAKSGSRREGGVQ